MKKGLFRRQILEIFLARVESVYIDQNILGRIFNFGTIVVSGTGGTKNIFTYIPKPIKFRNLVQDRLIRKND